MEALKNDKTDSIRIAAIVALAGNSILALLKITTGIISGSGALIADGIDSSADVIISIVALVVVRIISKPADAKHPWGHKKADTIAAAFLSFILFFCGAQLIINSVSKVFFGEQQDVPSFIAVIVTLISIAGKILLAWSQYIFGKRANSAMIKANAKNMASDALISIGVLSGLIISNIMGTGSADTIIEMLIGVWIIKTAIDIFLDVNLELMDGNNDIEPYHVIVDAINMVEGASNPHRARIRSIAGFWDIAFDIDISPERTILEAHNIASRVENEIKLRLENVFDIMIHVEPSSDDTAEIFGLSEEVMRGDRIE